MWASLPGCCGEQPGPIHTPRNTQDKATNSSLWARLTLGETPVSWPLEPRAAVPPQAHRWTALWRGWWAQWHLLTGSRTGQGGRARGGQSTQHLECSESWPCSQPLCADCGLGAVSLATCCHPASERPSLRSLHLRSAWEQGPQEPPPPSLCSGPKDPPWTQHQEQREPLCTQGHAILRYLQQGSCSGQTEGPPARFFF